MNRINKVEYNGQNTQYDYDANGNQTSVVEKDSAAGTTKTDTYVYDELNQLTHISGSDGSKSDYTYYATGLRASKNINGSTAVFTYDETKLLMEQTAGQTKTNIHGIFSLASCYQICYIKVRKGKPETRLTLNNK